MPFFPKKSSSNYRSGQEPVCFIAFIIPQHIIKAGLYDWFSFYTARFAAETEAEIELKSKLKILDR